MSTEIQLKSFSSDKLVPPPEKEGPQLSFKGKPKLRIEAELPFSNRQVKMAAGLPSVRFGTVDIPLFVTVTAPEKRIGILRLSGSWAEEADIRIIKVRNTADALLTVVFIRSSICTVQAIFQILKIPILLMK